LLLNILIITTFIVPFRAIFAAFLQLCAVTCHYDVQQAQKKNWPTIFVSGKREVFRCTQFGRYGGIVWRI
jgi:hypothetical protein